MTLVEQGGFSTDRGGSSAKHADELPADAETREQVQQQRCGRTSGQGDPEATRGPILELVDEKLADGFVTDYGIGDLTPLVGFVLAVVIYLALVPVFKPARGAPLPASGYEEPVHVDAASEA